MRIPVGVVGLGEMGSAHARNYMASPQADLIAVCDVVASRRVEFGAQYSIPTLHASAAEMAADPRVKAVTVAVPNRWHGDVAVKLLRAGKHVLVEKPMAASLADAQAMVQAAADNHVVLQTGFMWRFHRDVAFIRDAVAAGKIGKPFYVRYCAITLGPPGGQHGARVVEPRKREIVEQAAQPSPQDARKREILAKMRNVVSHQLRQAIAIQQVGASDVKLRIGELLHRDFGVAEALIAEALVRQRRDGGLLGEILVDMKAVAAEHVREVLVRQEAASLDTGLWYLRKSIAGGGIVLDMGVHGIDTVRYLLGSPATRSVLARTSTQFTRFWSDDKAEPDKDPVEDVALLLLEHEGGITSSIECAWVPERLDPRPEGHCEIIGSKGYASLFPTRIQYEENGRWRTESPVPSEPNDSFEMYQREVEHFLDCVKHGKKSINHPMESIETVKITSAAYESARTGSVIHF